jgi:hypothetical protein
MQMRTLMRCLAAVLVCAPASLALGQSGGQAIGYLALVSTPTAALSPVAKQWMLPDPAQGFGVETQWGHVSGNGGSINTFTSGINLPLAAGRGDVGFSAGTLRASCDVGDCVGYFVASSVVEGRVLERQSGGASFVLGLSGRLGFAKPSDATVWSAAASVPLSLAVNTQPKFQLVTFVAPGFGWGHISEGSDSQSGTRFMLGGGVGVISSTSGVGVTIGVQKVFITGGKLVVGAGLTWSRR